MIKRKYIQHTLHSQKKVVSTRADYLTRSQRCCRCDEQIFAGDQALIRTVRHSNPHRFTNEYQHAGRCPANPTGRP